MDHTHRNLSIEKRVAIPYEEAVEKTREALAGEGFGVLTEINIQQTMKEKLDADFQRYVILGACNPPLAKRALDNDLRVGLLLPCNVIVYEDGDGAVIAAVNPDTMVELIDNETMQQVADEAKAKLNRALANL